MNDITTRFHQDSDGSFTVQRVQDVEPILEMNKALQNWQQKTTSFRHIGSVPNVILEKWITEEGAPVLSMSGHEFKQFIRRKLNDPDYRWLKTTDGRL